MQDDVVKTEEWRPIPDYEGYKVSNMGRVKSLKRKGELILRAHKSKAGYCIVTISKNGVGKTRRVHRLVARAFIGPSDLDIDHINGIRDDNRLENLEYVTRGENTLRGKLCNNENVLGYYKCNRKNRKKRYVAKISHNKKNVTIGYFMKPEEAREAYLKYKKDNGLSRQ